MMDFLQDLWGFMKERKKFWLAPIIIITTVAARRRHKGVIHPTSAIWPTQ